MEQKMTCKQFHLLSREKQLSRFRYWSEKAKKSLTGRTVKL
ncbi:MAG: hypothetical protein ACLROS_03685 [Faecalibacterium sp.]